MTLLSNAFVAIPSTAAHTVSSSVNDNGSVAYSPSPQSTSVKGPAPSSASPGSTSVTDPTPSQVLAMTIRKKRKVLRNKDRNLRVEILLSSTIRRLCQEIGDHLRARRTASTKRKSTPEHEDDGSSTPTVRHCPAKRSRVVAEDEALRKEEVGLVEASGEARDSSSVCPVGPLALDDQRAENHSTPSNSENTSGSPLKRKAENDSAFHKRVPRSSSPSISEDSFNDEDPFGLDEFFRSLRTCRVGGSKR